MTDLLPPGAHPNDAAVPLGVAALDHSRPVPLDSGGPPPTQGAQPWHVSNGRALPVFQRAASTWATGLVVVDANQASTARVVGRRPGRTRLRLWVPAAVIIGGAFTNPTPAGVMFGPDEGELQVQGSGGSILGVGESVDIHAEGGVWVGLVPGQTLGYVQYLHEFDPEGGGFDL